MELQKLYYDSGLVCYEGELKDKKPCGHGTFYYPSGMVCAKGIWEKEDTWSGTWYVTHNEMYYYKGSGSWYNPNGGLFYQGRTENGTFNGHGITYVKGRVIYDGFYKNGKRHGKGTSYYEPEELEGDVTRIKYIFYLEKQINYIQERMAKRSHKQYEGDWEDNKRHGNGVTYYRDGAIQYRGEFKNGIREGKGVLFAADGNIWYEGEFADDVANGKGKDYYACQDGKIYFEGVFKDGYCYHGTWYNFDRTVKFKGYKDEKEKLDLKGNSCCIN